MARYISTPQVADTHAVVSVSGPPELARAIWDAITKTGITIDGTENVRPAYVTGDTFSEDRRNPGFVSVRYANLIYHTES